MPRGKKQANIRNYNQSLIIGLIKSRRYSCNEIARALKMSNSTVEYIIDELTEIGILEIDDTARSRSVGRSPIYYRINNRFGCVVAVDFVNSKFSVCDICGNLLFGAAFPCRVSPGAGGRLRPGGRGRDHRGRPRRAVVRPHAGLDAPRDLGCDFREGGREDGRLHFCQKRGSVAQPERDFRRRVRRGDERL